MGESDDRFVLDCANGPTIDGHAKIDDGSFAATGLKRSTSHDSITTAPPGAAIPRCRTRLRVYPCAIDKLGSEHPIRE